MSRKPERKSLGRGLSALLGDLGDDETPEDAPTPDRGPTSAPIDRLHPNPDQPRRDFRERELEELTTSVRERGVIQPIIVRPDPRHPGDYQIVAGERRWRAAQRAQLHDVPIVVRSLDDRAVLEIAIIENVQRADLNPVEEALGYGQLLDRFSYTQEELARIVGKSRSHIANTLRLLQLPAEVQAMLRSGTLTAGHARALITATDPIALANKAVGQGLTVRQVEELARRLPNIPRGKPQSRPAEKDADTRQIEGDLSAAIGMSVRIDHNGPDGAGTLTITYKNLDDLDRLLAKLAE